MSLIRQKHNPSFYSFDYKYQGYPNIQETWISIETGKSKVDAGNIAGAGFIFAASALISLVWWPILFANLITLIVWIAVPLLRPIPQEEKRYLYRDGTDYQNNPKIKGPVINWKLENDPLYKDAINDWLEEVRVTNNIGTNKDDWTKYFRRVEKIIGKEKAIKAPGPNFEKIKVLEELLKEGK